MKSNLIYICNDNNEFLKQLEYLNDEYNKIATFYKFVRTKRELSSQINYLKNVKILAFSGFTGQRIIKITIKDSLNNKYCINYKFPKDQKKYGYMIRFLRQMEQVKK